MATNSQIMECVVRAHADSGTEPHVRPVVNVYTFKRLSGLFAPSKSAFVTAMVAGPLTTIQAGLSVSYVTDFIDVRLLDDPLDPYLSTVLTKDGTVTGDSLPSVNNVTLQLKTGVRGRKWRGSKHYGPIAESNTTLDRLQTTPLATWTTFAAALLAGFTDGIGDIWTPYLVSRSSSTFTPTVATVVGYPVIEVTVNQTVGIMRRRKQPSR